MCVCVCACVCMCVCLCVCLCVYVCLCVFVPAQVGYVRFGHNNKMADVIEALLQPLVIFGVARYTVLNDAYTGSRTYLICT